MTMHAYSLAACDAQKHEKYAEESNLPIRNMKTALLVAIKRFPELQNNAMLSCFKALTFLDDCTQIEPGKVVYPALFYCAVRCFTLLKGNMFTSSRMSLDR